MATFGPPCRYSRNNVFIHDPRCSHSKVLFFLHRMVAILDLCQNDVMFNVKPMSDLESSWSANPKKYLCT